MIRVMVGKQSGLNRAGNLFLSVVLFLFGLTLFVVAVGSTVVAFSAMHSTASHGAGSWIAEFFFLLIELLFAAAGVGLMIFARKTPGNAFAQRQRQLRHPDQPWLWREDWEQGFARATGRNNATFRMSSMPGVLGGKLRGVVETGDSPCIGKMDLTLNCILWKRQYRNGMSEILWQETATSVCSPGSNGSQAAVEFDIPFDLRPTGSTGHGGWEDVFWSLTARSEGGRFHASFSIPVFSTAESSEKQTRESIEAKAGAKLGAYVPEAGRIQKTMTPEGIHYHFPRARNMSMASMMSLMALVVLGIASTFALHVNHSLALGMLIGALMRGVLGLLLLGMAVWLWTAETTVTAATHELTIHATCLGIAHTQVIHGEEIRGFEIKPGMQKGGEVWYDVWLQTSNGKSANAGTGMSKTEAEWFVAELRNDLGIAGPGR